MSNLRRQLVEIYETLLTTYGPQGWWPAATATETIIGAILVQHTAWRNAASAIASLKAADLLDFKALATCDHERLARLIRSAGTPLVRSARLQSFARWLGTRYGFNLDSFLALPPPALRAELLSISGVGPETADCIMLYAAGVPTFVIDAYTRRVFTRHRLVQARWKDRELKHIVECHLPNDRDLFNEFHALLVRVGKEHCRSSPHCSGCPLEPLDHTIEPGHD
jgi:endonuclease-3 related protein